jgi:DNA-binding transcriptional ArsR family regulator
MTQAMPRVVPAGRRRRGTGRSGAEAAAESSFVVEIGTATGSPRAVFSRANECSPYIHEARYVSVRYTTSMQPPMQDAAHLAAALGETPRLAILTALLEREATVSDLASRLKLAQPRVSTHLARLRAAGLVTRVSMGRHRAYRTDAARVKRLLGALYAAGSRTLRQLSRGARERLRDTPLRRARTCYDHLAGIEGVQLLREMRRRGWLRHGARDGLAYELTASGMRALLGRGVDVEAARASRRRFTAACLDWTERQPHLGGALGAAILYALCAAGYVRRRPKRRDVRIVKPLAGWLALPYPAHAGAPGTTRRHLRGAALPGPRRHVS